MRKEEAVLVKNIIADLGGEFNILNIGSSNKDFREKKQPHIGKLFENLAKSNKIIHLDIKRSEGVDLIVNIFNKVERNNLSKQQFDFYLVSNLLEHLDIEFLANFSSAIDSLMKKGDYFLIIQPSSYPRHIDPIDNYYRPNVSSLEGLMSNSYDLISSGEVISTTYFDDLKNSSIMAIARSILVLFFPFFRLNAWLGNWHRLLWLFRPYKSSYCLFKKLN